MTTLKSMSQSVQSLGNKALAHPHWAGKTGFAVLTLILLGVCAVALVVLPLMFLVVGMVKNALYGKSGLTDADYNDRVESQNDLAHEEWIESMYGD